MFKSIAIFSTLLIGAFSGSLFAGERVDICHYDIDGDGSVEMITVNQNSVQKHLDNHGDYLTLNFITANDDPIWSNDDAQGGVCAARCENEGGIFTGSWWTTQVGVSSVCLCYGCP